MDGDLHDRTAAFVQNFRATPGSRTYLAIASGRLSNAADRLPGMGDESTREEKCAARGPLSACLLVRRDVDRLLKLATLRVDPDLVDAGAVGERVPPQRGRFVHFQFDYKQRKRGHANE